MQIAAAEAGVVLPRNMQPFIASWQQGRMCRHKTCREHAEFMQVCLHRQASLPHSASASD